MQNGMGSSSYPTETMILIILKKEDGLSLEELSKKVGISKMAVLKHMQTLENRNIVERRIVKKAVGRPLYRFYLLSDASTAFGNSNDKMLESLIDFLVESGNEDKVVQFLKKKYKKIEQYYRGQLSKRSGEKRVEELARLRYLENYMPELKKNGRDKFEMLEFNCPIYSISRKFGEACALEEKLFENVLEMKVETTHTQINGFGTCRFLIEKNKSE